MSRIRFAALLLLGITTGCATSLLATQARVRSQRHIEWVSLFLRMAATPNDPASFQEYGVAQKRLAAEDSESAQMEVAVLTDVYEKNPETRVQLSNLLFGAVQIRQSQKDSAEAFKAILPTLIAHFLDPDRQTRVGARKVFWFRTLEN